MSCRLGSGPCRVQSCLSNVLSPRVGSLSGSVMSHFYFVSLINVSDGHFHVTSGRVSDGLVHTQICLIHVLSRWGRVIDCLGPWLKCHWAFMSCIVGSVMEMSLSIHVVYRVLDGNVTEHLCFLVSGPWLKCLWAFMSCICWVLDVNVFEHSCRVFVGSLMEMSISIHVL